MLPTLRETAFYSWGLDLGAGGGGGGGSGSDFIDEVLDDSGIFAWATPPGLATAVDQSGNGRNGTVSGAVNDAAGVLAGFDALSLDGTNDYTALAHETALNVADTFTLEIILKRGRINNSTGEILFHKGTGAPTLYFPASGAQNQVMLRRAGVGDVCQSSVALGTTGFHHVGAAKDGATSAKIVQDGVDVTGAVTNQTMVNTTDPLRVGLGVTGVQPFQGIVVFAAYYPTALSVSRLQAHHAAIGS